MLSTKTVSAELNQREKLPSSPETVLCVPLCNELYGTLGIVHILIKWWSVPTHTFTCALDVNGMMINDLRNNFSICTCISLHKEQLQFTSLLHKCACKSLAICGGEDCIPAAARICQNRRTSHFTVLASFSASHCCNYLHKCLPLQEHFMSYLRTAFLKSSHGSKQIQAKEQCQTDGNQYSPQKSYCKCPQDPNLLLSSNAALRLIL